MAGLYFGHRFGNSDLFPLCSLVMFCGLVIAYSVLTGGIGAPVKVKENDDGASVLRGRPLLLRMMALYALSQSAVGMIANVLILYIDVHFGIHEGDLPRLILGPALFVGVLALPIGHAADKIGRARAVWISYVLATAGMLIVASTSLFEPTKQMLSLPVMVFSVGLLLLIASYILGTPAWLGLTSVQVDEAHQAKALSLMQTSQGLGLVLGAGLVMSASALLVRTESFYRALREDRFYAALQDRWPKLHLSEMGAKFVEMDAVPITMWLWASACVLLLCVIGSLVWVGETEHPDSEEMASQQPPALSEF
jgi:MFS family permease